MEYLALKCSPGSNIVYNKIEILQVKLILSYFLRRYLINKSELTAILKLSCAPSDFWVCHVHN